MLLNPYRFAGAGVSDPYWSDVTLLLNQDQASLTDMSSYATTLAYVGTASRSTVQFKYGTGSSKTGGANNRISTSSTGSQFQFGTGDFTVEAWIRLNTSTSSMGICGNWNNTAGSWGWRLTTNTMIFHFGATSYSRTAITFATGTWYHVAASRVSGVLRLFLDGVQQGANQASTEDVNSALAINIGILGTISLTANTLDGWIDDLRVTKGVGRYTTTFAPPSKLPES